MLANRKTSRISFHHRKAAGFSLVELLVVVTLVGVLIALLLPAVQAAREAARQLQCRNNIKQLALAALNHESAHGFLPTGGWGYVMPDSPDNLDKNRTWSGHPDRGYDKCQPGGWVYNVLPFIGQEALHDLGISGGNLSIQDANAIRLATPLSGLNCPSRRPASVYMNRGRWAFAFTAGTLSSLSRSDYAMNAGNYLRSFVRPAVDTQQVDCRQVKFLDQAYVDSRIVKLLGQAYVEGQTVSSRDLLFQTGVCHQRSQVKLSDITDGAGNTFLLGEKFLSVSHYIDGVTLGDAKTMYGSDSLELLRVTGYQGSIGSLPRQDDNSSAGVSSTMQWFGSAHAHAFNISFCDGAVRPISYSIDGETYRCLGNRCDGKTLDGNRF
jgi:prepilin-type N-terminal cleavage/methylation domain-containing protein